MVPPSGVHNGVLTEFLTARKLLWSKEHVLDPCGAACHALLFWHLDTILAFMECTLDVPFSAITNIWQNYVT